MQSAPSFAWLDEFRQLGPGQLQDMTGRLAAVEPPLSPEGPDPGLPLRPILMRRRHLREQERIGSTLIRLLVAVAHRRAAGDPGRLGELLDEEPLPGAALGAAREGGWCAAALPHEGVWQFTGFEQRPSGSAVEAVGAVGTAHASCVVADRLKSKGASIGCPDPARIGAGAVPRTSGTAQGRWYSNRLLLAWLHEERTAFGPHHAQLVERHVPATYPVADRTVLIGGTVTPLLAHLVAERTGYLLKSARPGARPGTVLGRATSPGAWHRALEDAVSGRTRLVAQRLAPSGRVAVPVGRADGTWRLEALQARVEAHYCRARYAGSLVRLLGPPDATGGGAAAGLSAVLSLDP